MLSQFQDNFDYQTISRLIRGIVNEEILSCKVFAHLDDSGKYTCRVSNLRKYMQVSFDSLRRWTYPYVPDMNLVYTLSTKDQRTTSALTSLVRGETHAIEPRVPSTQYIRDSKGGSGFYKDGKVNIARSAQVGGSDLTALPPAVGEHSSIGPNSRIISSVIGRNCRIGTESE